MLFTQHQFAVPHRIPLPVGEPASPTFVEAPGLKHGRWGLPVALFLIAALRLPAQCVITEAMRGNESVRLDQDRNPSDWVEVTNRSPAPVNLLGWALTDDAAENPRRWRFPSTPLAPLESVLVFCSGKDRSFPDRELHANFRFSKGATRVALVSPLSEEPPQVITIPGGYAGCSHGFPEQATTANLIGPGSQGAWWVPGDRLRDSRWRERGFNTEGWQTLTMSDPMVGSGGGIEPGSAPLSTAGQGASIWVRWPFTASELPEGASLHLEVTTQAGVLVSLNGQEIGRARFDGEVKPDSVARLPQDEMEHHGRLELSWSARMRPLIAGENVLAVHLLKTSNFAPDPTLSVRLRSIVRSAEPVGDPTAWAPLEFATPGYANVAEALSCPEPPEATPTWGWFDSSQSVRLALPSSPHTPIVYTVDGSEPTADSPPYSGELLLTSTTEVRARARPARGPLGPTASFLYVQQDARLATFGSDLPVICIAPFGRREDKVFARSLVAVYEPKDPEIRTALNRPGGVSGYAAIKTRGSSTLALPKRNYSLELRQADQSDREAELLGMPKDADWILYGSYNFDYAHLRNPLVFGIATRLGLLAPKFRFVEVFVSHDGGPVGPEDYIGLYVLMEKIERGRNRVPLARLDSDDVEMPEISGGYILKIDRPGPGDRGFQAAGERLQFVEPKEREIPDLQRRWIGGWLARFYATLNSATAADPENGYARYIDVDNFIDYHFLNEYVRNPDAYTLSTYMHLERGGKLKMGPVWDYDRAMRTNADEQWVGKASETQGWTGDCYHGWWGILFRDSAFRARYRERGCAHLRERIPLAWVQAEVDRLASLIREAKERDRARWPIVEVDVFENDLIALKQWLADRDRWFRSELLEAPELEIDPPTTPLPCRVTLRHGNPEGTLWYTLDGGDPKLADGRVSPRALRYEGPVEVVAPSWLRARVHVGGLWTRLVQHHFSGGRRSIQITEIMFNPGGGRDYEFIELWNCGTEAVALGGLKLEGGAVFAWPANDPALLSPGECAVLVNDRKSFESRYDPRDIRVLGEYLGRLSNTGAELTLRGPAGESLCEVTYEDWYPESDGKGHSLVLTEPKGSPKDVIDRAGWRASRDAGGSPGRLKP